MIAYGMTKAPGVGWFFDYYPEAGKRTKRVLRKRARRAEKRELDPYEWGSDDSTRGWRHVGHADP